MAEFVIDSHSNSGRFTPDVVYVPASGDFVVIWVRIASGGRNLRAQFIDSDYQFQAETMYDGRNQRLQTVAYIAGVPFTMTYTLDRQARGVPLLVSSDLGDMFILYGRLPLGEYGEEWRYYLGDAQFSVRQLVNSDGALSLSRTYDPFGLVLQEEGAGSAQFGFAGSQAGGMGLLYVNGRYFDPRTGRYLSPDNSNFDPRRPGTLNGYIGAVFLLTPGFVLLVGWRKRKGKKGYSFIWFLFSLLLAGSLVTCGPKPPPPTPIPPLLPPPTEQSTAVCTNGYERPPQCPRYPLWNSHKSRMQARLDTATATVASRTNTPQQQITYAPETEELRKKNYIREDGEAAVSTTLQMHRAMSRAGRMTLVGYLPGGPL